MSSNPSAIESHLDLNASNEELELQPGSFDFTCDGTNHSAAGVVVFEFAPEPTIRGKINGNRHDLWNASEIRVDGRVMPQAKLTSIGNGETKFRLGGHETPATFVDFIDVHVLNMVRLHGDWITYSTGASSNGRTHFEHDGWKLTLDAVEGCDERIRQLKATGGYGVTHMLRMERADGSQFSTGAAPLILSEVNLLLSFIAGHRVGLVAGHGFEHGRSDPTWFSLHDPWTAPMTSLRGWLDVQRPTSSSEVAATIARIWPILDEDWSGILNWFLSSDVHPVDVGIVTAQASIEKLAYKVIELEQGATLPHAAAEQIRELATHFGMGTAVPSSNPALDALVASDTNLKDGAGGSTWVRNTLVHATPAKQAKLRSLPGLRREAWEFMMNFLVEAILRRVGHKGEVCRIGDPSNRLTLS